MIDYGAVATRVVPPVPADGLEFGQRVKLFRNAKRWRQDELAEAVGLSRTQMSNIERCQIETTLYRFTLLCRALGVSPNDLLGWSA